MTIYNACILPDRLAIGADSNVAASLPNEPHWQNVGCSGKMIPLPWINAVLVGAGSNQVFADCVQALIANAWAEDLHVAAEALGPIARNALDDYQDMRSDFHAGSEPGDQVGCSEITDGKTELVLAGWSERHGECRAFIYSSTEGVWGLEKRKTLRGTPGPIHYSMDEARPILRRCTAESAAEGVALMYHTLPQSWRTLGYGGPVVTATIDQYGMAVKRHQAAEDMPDPRQRGGRRPSASAKPAAKPLSHRHRF